MLVSKFFCVFFWFVILEIEILYIWLVFSFWEYVLVVLFLSLVEEFGDFCIDGWNVGVGDVL